MLPSGTLFHGAVERRELTRLYQRADVVVFPSLSDGFGLVILEAMSSGVPVVATTSSGGPDAIEDGANGLLVQPGDSNAIATALERLMDSDLRLELGVRARQRALSEFSLEAYGARLEAALHAPLFSPSP